VVNLGVGLDGEGDVMARVGWLGLMLYFTLLVERTIGLVWCYITHPPPSNTFHFNPRILDFPIRVCLKRGWLLIFLKEFTDGVTMILDRILHLLTIFGVGSVRR
jgi:hypothetical protein